MDTHFGMHNYSLKDLFRDEQRHILRLIIAGTLQEFEDKFITLYENSKSLMGFLRETGMPVPHYFMTTAETALNLKLQKMFTSETIEMDRLKEDVSEIGSWNVAVDTVALEFIIRRRTGKDDGRSAGGAGKCPALNRGPVLVEAVASLPVAVNLWQTQNMYWTMLQSRASDLRAGDADTIDSDPGAKRSEIWGNCFFSMYLRIGSGKGRYMNSKGLRIPVSTYRLQFNAHFRFSDAREIVPYLHAPRHQRHLRITLLQGERGQPARLRHPGPEQPEPGDRLGG